MYIKYSITVWFWETNKKGVTNVGNVISSSSCNIIFDIVNFYKKQRLALGLGLVSVHWHALPRNGTKTRLHGSFSLYCEFRRT